MKFEVTYKWFEEQINEILKYNEWMDKLWDTDVFTDDFLDKIARMLDRSIQMLIDVMGDNDNGWIGYWLWELDAGKKWEPGDVEDDEGHEVKLQTVSDLWLVLTEGV